MTYGICPQQGAANDFYLICALLGVFYHILKTYFNVSIGGILKTSRKWDSRMSDNKKH